MQKIKDVPQALVKILVRILTWTYTGALKYHTLYPIADIHKNQDCHTPVLQETLTASLGDFRQKKEEELSFVTKAATLSAAAVIGVFSWPSIEQTHWAAKMLWNWSFFLSIFSLISSAPTRLLRNLPEKDSHCNMEYSKESLSLALNLFLQPTRKRRDPELGAKVQPRRISRRMLWIWQCPTMLMNYSWVLFLVGFGLHILTPVFDRSEAKVSSRIALVTISGCSLVVLNFIFCASITRHRLVGDTSKANSK